jgi:hypothetical protein
MLPDWRLRFLAKELDAGYWMLDAGYLMLDAGYWMLDAGYSILDLRTLEIGGKMKAHSSCANR